MSQRTDRIDELLRQEIGEILTRDVDDPRVGFHTITDVETTADLRHARVWVSIIGQKAERDQTMSALGRAMPFVRRQLGGRLRLKRIPELHLRLDDSVERGTRVLHLIQELEEGHVPEDEPASTPGESLPTPVARLPHEEETQDVEPPPWEIAPPETAARRGRRGRRPASGPRGTRSGTRGGRRR
jgi:ribosome-binding factor A